MRGKKVLGMLLGGKGAGPGSFILRVLKSGSLAEVLGEKLKRIFVSLTLICQNEIYSLDFTCPWVLLAEMTLTGFLLSPSLSRVIYAIYPLVGEKCKPLTLTRPCLGKIGFGDLLDGCKLFGPLSISVSLFYLPWFTNLPQ